MGRPYRSIVPVAAAFFALAACAGIAGLEDPDPTATPKLGDDAAANGGGDGGSILTPENVLITPEKLDIKTSCAGSGETPYVSLLNQGEADVPYEVQVPEGSPFTLRDDLDASVSTMTGVLPKGKNVLLYLRALATQAGNFSGQLFITVAGRVKPIPVQVTVNGGALAFVPALVDFGEVRQNTLPPAQNVDITNTGTEPVNIVKLTSSSDAGLFAITTPSINIPAGDKVTVPATFLPRNAGPQVTADYVPETATPICGTLPTLTLKGKSVNQDVTVNPPTLGFGDVDCLSAGGASQTITVSNYAVGMPVSFTVNTAADSWFNVVPAALTVPAATNDSNPGKTNIAVTLKPLVGKTLDPHSESIDVVIAGAPSITKSTVVTVRSVGAILAITPGTLSFTAAQTKPFSVRNVGNKFVYVRHSASNDDFSIVNGTNESPLANGVPFSLNVEVRFVEAVAGTYTADITTARTTSIFYPTNGNICEPPTVVKVTGTN